MARLRGGADPRATTIDAAIPEDDELDAASDSDDDDGHHGLGQAKQPRTLPQRMVQLERKMNALSQNLDAQMDRLRDDITARIDAQFGEVLAVICAPHERDTGAAVNGELVIDA